MKGFIFIVSLLWLCASCSNHQNDVALAKVGDHYLYSSDVQGVSDGASPEDSVSIVKKYIESWVEQQLIAQKADDELPSSAKDFEDKIELYRRSLLIQAYESWFLKNNLDTVVSDTEVKSYYQSHMAEFELKSNILRLNFVKFHIGSPSVEKVKRLLFSSAKTKQLAQICSKEAENYFLDDKTWLLFEDVLKEIPLRGYQQDIFLKNNRSIEFKDSSYHYLVSIKEVKIKDEVSPLLFERENIQAVILNTRKDKIILKLRADIKKKAMENSDYEIYQK